MYCRVFKYLCPWALALFSSVVLADEAGRVRGAPDWLIDGVIYQINMRSFAPHGQLHEAAERLPTLAELGVTIVYLCPVFEADDDPREEFWSPRQKGSGTGNPKNPYRMSDYYHVDPEYGTDADLKALVEEAHRLGLKVMLDLVYLHCGPSAKVLKEHPDFAQHDEQGNVVNAAWGFPKLNFDNPDLREYLWRNMEYWVRDFHVDGYRLDVGDGVPLDFWEEGRRRLDAIRPDIVLLSEGTREEDQLRAVDISYGFALASAIAKVMDKGESAAVIRDTCEKRIANRPRGFRYINYTDNHDISNDDYQNRQEKRWGGAACRALLTLCFTLDGVPMLYNGQEAAEDGRHSIFGYFPIDWSRLETDQGRGRFAFVQSLARLRREYPPLRRGSIEWLDNSAGEKVLSFLRAAHDEALLVLINLKDTEAQGETSAPGTWENVFGGGSAAVAEGKVRFTLGPYGFAVLRRL
ncbi:MAG: alpha-glucosidase C-terminal domain-containing protein [Thermoguttaceae bacterium]|nr:alpha-glucosidase C-terminal domain-containing protein [Thermoguttaceae bacterium]